VVVHDGVVVGEGFHQHWGGAHAEVAALEAAGGSAAGATLYVSLEPCHHTGKTGPCTQVIEAAGIERVVFATRETNPAARGGGEWLRSRGIEVERGICEVEASDLNAIHLSAVHRKRPFVALKYAMSLDARLAETPGRSTQVTSGAARTEAHKLRAGHAAVMVGIGTVLADDPALTVREWPAPRVAPTRVVLDSKLQIPLTSRLVETAAEVPLLVFTGSGANPKRLERLVARAVEVEQIDQADGAGGLDLELVLASLWKRELGSVLCEGGGALGSSLLAGGLVDRFYAFIAPMLFGEPGVPGFHGSWGRVSRDWRIIQRRFLGPVTLIVLGPQDRAGAR
jgi:diaminohydroxyphosphoribosylaminopyrimidine deaminase/5-amino-6-(5-phosphoribosylamino)uracil reductase